MAARWGQFPYLEDRTSGQTSLAVPLDDRRDGTARTEKAQFLDASLLPLYLFERGTILWRFRHIPAARPHTQRSLEFQAANKWPLPC